MSDHDSDLTPAQDDAVRALLASAKHSDPTPPEVVARLEETLASLTAERRETHAPVVTLASRRRRTAATLVLAAAAVVVAGVGIGQVLPNGGSDDAGSTAGSATSAEGEMSTGESDGAFGAEDDDSPDAGGDAKQSDTDMRAQESAPVPSASAFAALGALDGDAPLKPQVRKLQQTASTATFSADPLCPLPSPDASEVVSVTYNGLPGALIFRPPVGSTQQVDVFLCGDSDAFRSLKLRAP